MRNPEYIAVLAVAVRAVRAAMADHRLPDLTPEQLKWWFQEISVSDIKAAQRNVNRDFDVVWRRAA